MSIESTEFQNSTETAIGYIPCYVTALFVQTNGCYYIDGVDCWDEKRDARLYKGNLPVVAHPPCQLWGALAFVNYKRWGGEHNKPENDGGCFLSALDNVNRCGGVLEHPAKTRAFKKYGIEKPNGIGWQKSGEGWVCEVWQSSYGHRANKATWLYYKGNRPPYELNWERIKGTHQVGQECRQGIRDKERWRNKPSLGKKEANATPTKFRDEIIRLALYAVT
jgi:hypothetical protein